MNESEDLPSAERMSETATLELYKTAFARLNFQDEYLFKFSTVFLTAEGALIAWASTTAVESSPHYGMLALASAVGLFLACVWSLWTHHNDHWHSVWTGTLVDIEKNHLKPGARVF